MPWGIVYYRTRSGAVPAHEFLLGCPTNVRAKLLAILEVVRAAPPPAFSGGGFWEAVHGRMSGYYEVRRVGPGRRTTVSTASSTTARAKSSQNADSIGRRSRSSTA